jgi:hypothetical protein
MSAVTDLGAGEDAKPGETAPIGQPAVIPPVPPLPPFARAGAPQPAPPYAAPQDYAAPQGYPPPQAYGPAQGYAAPQGYAPQGYGYAPPEGYAPPPQGYGPYVPSSRPATPRGGSALGIVALALAIVATVGATILGAIAAFSIGVGAGEELVLDPAAIDVDWSILTPVREWVLLGELSFWGGTILGIWALVQGIVAIAKNRGRGWGIAAVVVAAIGPIAFGIGVQAFLMAGFASGASIGG